MLVHLLPLFLSNVLGVRTDVIGLIEGVAETTASLLKVFSGWLSDRMGQRKWLTVAGYSLSTLAKPFLFFATTWTAVLAVRFTDRVGKGIRTAPRDALIADSIDDKRRGLAFGLHRAGDISRRADRHSDRAAGGLAGSGPRPGTDAPDLSDGRAVEHSAGGAGSDRAGDRRKGRAGDRPARASQAFLARAGPALQAFPDRHGAVHAGQLLRRLPGAARRRPSA